MTNSYKNRDNKMPKNAKKYYCDNCDFECSKLSNFNIHLRTRKHEIMTNDDTKNAKNAKNPQNTKIYNPPTSLASAC